MYNPYVFGSHVYLRHPVQQDVGGPWHEWLSDEENTRWLSLQYWPNCVEKQQTFYESCLMTKDRLVLAIVDIATDKHIGICNLSGLNWVHRYCDVAIIMGDKDFRHGPHTLEAMSLLLRTAFLRLNMRIVKSSYAASNEVSQSIHDLFRFREVGRLPGLFWDRGDYVDNVISILTAESWFQRNRI
jgi:RimJ/RimL family protein N-acetyltransferase